LKTRATKNKPVQQQASSMGRLWFTPAKTAVEKAKREKPKREKVKADPAHVAAARELRDRWLEKFNSGQVLPAGKYHVAVALPEMRQAVKALPVAA
jgi:hypothetical protein